MRHVRSYRLFALALLLAGGPALAETTYHIDIPPEPLTKALQSFAEQSGLQVVYYAQIARGQMAVRVAGTLSAKDALTRLLSGTNLTFETVNEDTIAIRSAASGAASKNSAARTVSDSHDTAGLRLSQADIAPKISNPPTAENSENTPATAVEGAGRLEEIVVTAQKREERLQNVPISISVLGGGDLDRSTDQGIAETLSTVPGVLAQESYIGGGTQVAIRGVAASSTLLHGSSPVAYYLDSVPFGLIKTSVAPDSNAYDLERVEVLRGPQGTLYGASALNGVVRILTKDADLNEFEFKARTSFSDTEGGGGNYRGDAAVNVPIIDGKLAARAVVGYQDNSGWIDRPNEAHANDAELRNYRLKINAQPTDSLSIGASVWSSRDNYGAPSMAADNGRYSFAANEPMTSDYDAYGLKVGYDLPWFSVTSMTSYLDYKNIGILDLTPLGLPGIPFVNELFAHVLSQELDLHSAQAGPWQWTVGGIYRDEKDRLYQTITGVFPAPVDFNDTSHSFAGFGELTRLFLDGQLELTGGLRYFEDHVGTSENSSNTGVPGAPLIRASSDFNKTTPRAVLTWLPSRQLTVYASYSEGFRSGFQQQPNVITAAPDIPPVRADSLKNYEVGSKGNFLDGRVDFDTAVYYIQWNDVQSDNAILIDNIPVVGLVNGGSASGVGIDIALTVRPTDGLDFGVSFSTNGLKWNDAVLTSGGAVLFEKGDRLSLSPKNTAGGSANYSFPLGGSGYKGQLSASANYTSATYIKIATGFGQGDSILIARSSFSISAPAHWVATLYGDNLNNEHGRIQQAPFNIEDWSVRPRPRTIGLQLEYKY